MSARISFPPPPPVPSLAVRRSDYFTWESYWWAVMQAEWAYQDWKRYCMSLAAAPPTEQKGGE